MSFDAVAYPAADLLDIYLRRWGIERLFHKITDVFHLKALVNARAQGTVFRAALCLLWYNLTVVIRSPVAAGVERPPDAVSLEKLFGDVCRQLTGLIEVPGVAAVLAQYGDGTWTASRPPSYLAGVLGTTWRAWWQKSPPRKKSKPAATEYLAGGHSSVFKIVRGLHGTIPEEKKGTPDEQQRPSKQ